jgi:tetratricopeptide (TPR) repeat protein
VSIGHCLLDLQEYGEALKSYFKVEYLAPANTKVWRPIAWCSFLLGKFDQASDYYHRLLEKETNHYDLISLGHLEGCRGDRHAAIERYRQSIVKGKISFDEFLTVFENDREQLINQCIDPDDIPILLDHLRYVISA